LRSNPDFFTIQIMNNVFGMGFSSRLFRNIRSDLGLAYNVRGGYRCNYAYPGECSIIIQTKGASTAQAIRAITEEIKAITTQEIEDKELETAKDTFLNSFVFNFDSKVEIVNRMLEYQYYGYPRDFLMKMKKGVESVTKADILRVAGKYLRPDALHILVAGNPADFDEPLSVFGEVREVDITIPEPAREALPEATAESLARGKEILLNMAGSLGGSEAFSAVKSLFVQSKTTLQTPQGPMGMDIDQTLLLPDRSATLIKMPFGEIKQVVIPGAAWVDFNGIQDLPESRVEEGKATLFRNLVNLCTFAEKHTAQYLGEEEVDGELTDMILVSDESGRQVKIHVARASGYPVRQIYDATIQTGPATLTKINSDFRETAGGVTLPYREIVLADGKDYADSEVTLLEVNAEADESLFRKPE